LGNLIELNVCAFHRKGKGSIKIGQILIILLDDFEFSNLFHQEILKIIIK